MAKIHPQTSLNSYSDLASVRETFTIWMKSLVCHGNGYTVFNSKGQVVFRVDNYQTRCSSKVFLMDSSGQVLFSINRKKLQIFQCWEGYKWIDSKVKGAKPRFEVQRNHKVFSRDMTCNVTLECDEFAGKWWRIIGFAGKSTFKIIDHTGRLLAEVIQKQSMAGVPLGDDVLSLVVEPHIDQTLVMAIVIVYGLINGKLIVDETELRNALQKPCTSRKALTQQYRELITDSRTVIVERLL
ncbi:Protein LURP-one-related 11 [Forsythia ovata]|uniref:Protein LURP-one-related 11 n=1 Tax=Forsythia ovata TaxID=205694 RepID=A0ABD1W2A4_9LAMI